MEYLYYFELKRSTEKGVVTGLLVKHKFKGQEKTPGKQALKSPFPSLISGNCIAPISLSSCVAIINGLLISQCQAR